MPASGPRFRGFAALAARTADDKKGEDIALLHIGRLTTLAEYLLLVTVTSPAHMEAVQRRVEEVLDESGAQRLHRDGRGSEVWRVLDYGGLIIHLMHPTARQFYGLDRLYHDARHVRWADAPSAKPAREAAHG